jgi:uncharacterized membrane protein
MIAIAWLSAAGPKGQSSGALPKAPDTDVAHAIVQARCSMCHAAEPVWAGIAAAPKGIMLDTPRSIAVNARLIDLHAVRSQAMPPGNVTEMTQDERAMLAAWFEAQRR